MEDTIVLKCFVNLTSGPINPNFLSFDKKKFLFMMNKKLLKKKKQQLDLLKHF